MDHAAFMPDAELLSRAAIGEGAALLVLIERHGARLYAQAGGIDPVAAVFAALATSDLAPPPGADAAALSAALPAATRPLVAATPPDLIGALVQQVLTALPARQRAALAAAWEAACAPEVAGPIPVAAPGGTPAPDPAAPAALDRPTAALLAPPAERQDRQERRLGRQLDRYVERRSALRYVLPLAVVAVLIALWTARSLPPNVPDSPIQTWPTLPPRPTQVIAQSAPTATLPPTAAATATSAPAVTPTATAAPSPTSAPPTATAPVVAAAAEQPAPTAPPNSPAPVLAPPSPVAAQPEQPITLPTATPTSKPPSATPVRQTATATATPSHARLVLTTQGLMFGVEVGPRALVFINQGTDPLQWHILADSTWVDLAQTSGTLAPGATQAVPLTIARGALPTGDYTAAVQVLTNGGDGLIPVTMTVSPSNTTVSAFAEPSAPIGAEGCAEPTTYLVSADIAGATPPGKAAVYYSLNGGAEQTKPLTPKGQHYTGILGPFAEPGNVIYSLVITEASGNVVRSAAYSLTVNDCPSRVRTVPLAPPTTQPFTLGKNGHNIYTFTITQPGNLVVQLQWTGSAPRLSTLLYGPRYTDQPYEQRTGTASLSFAYPISDADVAAGGAWALHLVNYDTGDASGTLVLTFEPRGQPVPTSAPPPPTPLATPTPAPSPSHAPSPTAAPTATPAAKPPTATPAPASTPTAPRPNGSPTKTP